LYGETWLFGGVRSNLWRQEVVSQPKYRARGHGICEGV